MIAGVDEPKQAIAPPWPLPSFGAVLSEIRQFEMIGLLEATQAIAPPWELCALFDWSQQFVIAGPLPVQ
jgi:hypothetical protein